MFTLDIFWLHIMQYVYVMKSEKDGDLYIGCTKDLRARVLLHNAKKVIATRRRTPFTLVYYEAYIHPKDAYSREKYLKTRWGHTHLYKNLNNFFNSQKI